MSGSWRDRRRDPLLGGLAPDAELIRRDLSSISRARQAAAVLRAPVGPGDIRVGACLRMGIAQFPEDGEDGPTLLRHAELALRRAKQGRRGFRVWEDGLEPERSAG